MLTQEHAAMAETIREQLIYIKGALCGIESCINNDGVKELLANIQQDISDMLAACGNGDE